MQAVFIRSSAMMGLMREKLWTPTRASRLNGNRHARIIGRLTTREAIAFPFSQFLLILTEHTTCERQGLCAPLRNERSNTWPRRKSISLSASVSLPATGTNASVALHGKRSTRTKTKMARPISDRSCSFAPTATGNNT